VFDYNEPRLKALASLSNLEVLEVWNVVTDGPTFRGERFCFAPVQEEFAWIATLPKLASLTTNWELKNGDLEHFLTEHPLPRLTKLQLRTPLHLDRTLPLLKSLTSLESLTLQPASRSQCVIHIEDATTTKALCFKHLPVLNELTLLRWRHSSRAPSAETELLYSLASNAQKLLPAAGVYVDVNESNRTTSFSNCDCARWKPRHSVGQRFKYASNRPEGKGGTASPLFLHDEPNHLNFSERPPNDGQAEENEWNARTMRYSTLESATAGRNFNLHITRNCLVTVVKPGHFYARKLCLVCREPTKQTGDMGMSKCRKGHIS